MAGEVQLEEPAAALFEAAVAAVPTWLRRVTLAAADSDAVTDEMAVAIDAMVTATTDTLIGRLRDLLATDVDQQRTNPLSLFRSAVAAPNALLSDLGVPVPASDPFAAVQFPDDVYGLGPATWADIDPGLHEPGIMWGAWKAMTVLQRRRAEGLR